MPFRAMEIVFLGTGTSQGVPMIGCECEVCRSANPKNKRGRTSIHLKVGGYGVQVDAAPEFRLQCIENRIDRIDWVVLTHGHADHIAGMDDLRRFVDFRHGDGLPVYGSQPTLDRLRQMYPYAVRDRPEFPGYPAFVPHAVRPPHHFFTSWTVRSPGTCFRGKGQRQEIHLLYGLQMGWVLATRVGCGVRGRRVGWVARPAASHPHDHWRGN